MCLVGLSLAQAWPSSCSDNGNYSKRGRIGHRMIFGLALARVIQITTKRSKFAANYKFQHPPKSPARRGGIEAGARLRRAAFADLNLRSNFACRLHPTAAGETTLAGLSRTDNDTARGARFWLPPNDSSSDLLLGRLMSRRHCCAPT